MNKYTIYAQYQQQRCTDSVLIVLLWLATLQIQNLAIIVKNVHTSVPAESVRVCWYVSF